MPTEIEDDGFVTVHHTKTSDGTIPRAAKQITLRAAIHRISRQSEIMAGKTGPNRQAAEEIRLLAEIALRCLEPSDA